MALLEVRGLTKLYRMGDSIVRALDGVDLTIERGDFVAIAGASGSGKSTMMHLLGCLDRPTSGTYILNGRDVSGLPDRELAAIRNRQIGFVFQTFNLINRTSALENVAVPLFYARKTNTRGAAVQALERVGLALRASHNPNELSGGERQRVAIARSIVNNPHLVFADEPTGNLDSRTGEQIIELFRQLNEQGVTIVMVTHEPDIARHARRIVLMRDGKIVSDRPTAEVIAEEGQPSPQRRTLASAVAAVPAPQPIHQTPAATPAPVQAEEQAPVNYASMTPRLMRGATAGLTCGLLAAGLLAVTTVTQWILATVYDLHEFDPSMRRMPPAPVLVGSAASCLALVAGLVLGIIAIALSTQTRRRIRTEPGNWLGRRRALAGLILGWLSVGLPAVYIVVSIVKRLT